MAYGTVTLNAGSGGDTVAVDDIAGSEYQRVKLALGAEGAAVDAVAGAGNVSTGVQRITLAADDPAVVALQILDNIVAGSEAQVDIVAALPAGTNNIGDVDVLTVITGTGATNLGKAADAVAGATDTGVAILAIRDDALTTLTPADGDYAPLRVNSTGALHAHIASGSIAGIVDDAAFTPAVSEVLPIGFTFDDSSPDSVNEGDIGAARMSANRNIYTTIRDAAGNERGLNIDASGFATVNVNGTVTVGSHAVTNAGTFAVQPTGSASGGLSIFRSLDIDETEEDVKTSAGTLYFIHAINMVATTRYLKFYNATAANVTVGSTTPVLTFPVPPNGTTGAGFTVAIPQGLAFATAISVACTTGLADADTGAPGANDVIINLGYT